MLLTLFTLSLIGGLFSGLLGVGGAVLLIPMMLSIPPMLGVGTLTMHEVAGITMIQVLAASAIGCLSHRKSGFTHTRVILAVGIPMGLFSFVGAAASKAMQEQHMLMVFGVLVVVAMIMLLKPLSTENAEESSVPFNHAGCILCGGGVGLLAGIVGAGGGFMLIPGMIRILKIPMRMAVGSSLGIVFLGALMGSLGKLLTFQVPAAYLVPAIAGSLPASLLGATISKKMPADVIRRILLVLVILILVKTWFDIFTMTTGSPT